LAKGVDRDIGGSGRPTRPTATAAAPTTSSGTV